jgi:hypothetical protein
MQARRTSNLAGTCATTSRTYWRGFTSAGMARPPIRAGELSKIVVAVLPSGRYRARASTRDDTGALHRLAAVADTEEEARADVRRQAMGSTKAAVDQKEPIQQFERLVRLVVGHIHRNVARLSEEAAMENSAPGRLEKPSVPVESLRISTIIASNVCSEGWRRIVTLLHAPVAVWLDGSGVPRRLVWEGRRYKVTDTPTPTLSLTSASHIHRRGCSPDGVSKERMTRARAECSTFATTAVAIAGRCLAPTSEADNHRGEPWVAEIDLLCMLTRVSTDT